MSVLHTLLRSFAADGMKMMVMQWEARMMMKSRLLKQQTMGKAGENWPGLYWIRLKVYLGSGWNCIEGPAGSVSGPAGSVSILFYRFMLPGRL